MPARCSRHQPCWSWEKMPWGASTVAESTPSQHPRGRGLSPNPCSAPRWYQSTSGPGITQTSLVEPIKERKTNFS